MLYTQTTVYVVIDFIAFYIKLLGETNTERSFPLSLSLSLAVSFFPIKHH